jgi:hypothetical protein
MSSWCSGRDLDPGRRLERPVYLTGLYYRSITLLSFELAELLFFSIYSYLVFFDVAHIQT